MAAYGATHSLQRVTALQSLCRKPGPSTADDGSPDALLFVAGQDGDQNTGSAALVRYLLHGRSGAELVDSVLSSADEDDAIVVVRAASIGVYCNHAVWKRLQPLTVLPMGCDGLRRKLRSPVLRVEFVMWWGSASSHLRGLMMAKRLSKVFGANASVEAVSGFEFAQRATPVDFCICVKWCVDPAPQHCRARGGLAVLDLLDNEDEWRRALRNESAVVRRAALKRAG